MGSEQFGRELGVLHWYRSRFCEVLKLHLASVVFVLMVTQIVLAVVYVAVNRKITAGWRFVAVIVATSLALFLPLSEADVFQEYGDPAAQSLVSILLLALMARYGTRRRFIMAGLIVFATGVGSSLLAGAIIGRSYASSPGLFRYENWRLIASSLDEVIEFSKTEHGREFFDHLPKTGFLDPSVLGPALKRQGLLSRSFSPFFLKDTQTWVCWHTWLTGLYALVQTPLAVYYVKNGKQFPTFTIVRYYFAPPGKFNSDFPWPIFKRLRQSPRLHVWDPISE